LPSLPHAFEHFGFAEPHSDYVIWPGGAAPRCRRDLRAHDLGRIIVDRALGAEWDTAIGRSGAGTARDRAEDVVTASRYG
jgi:hypothetical protein